MKDLVTVYHEPVAANPKVIVNLCDRQKSKESYLELGFLFSTSTLVWAILTVFNSQVSLNKKYYIRILFQHPTVTRSFFICTKPIFMYIILSCVCILLLKCSQI